KHTAMTPSVRTIWNTNAPTRETAAEGRDVGVPRDPARAAKSTPENAMHTPRNPRNHGPIALIANVWTEGTTPLRTMNVPNTTRRKARIRRPKFHARRRPRRGG